MAGSSLNRADRATCRALLESERKEVLGRIERHERPAREAHDPMPDEFDQASFVAHGLFLLIDGVFRLVHIPRQQLGAPHVSAFLRRASRIVRQALKQPRAEEVR